MNIEEAKKIEKLGAVDIVTELQKKHGKENITRLSSTSFDNIDVAPTGIKAVDDDCFLVGGFPRGRITQIRGTESSGKTTICLAAASEAQKKGGEIAIIDFENALDKNWCKINGVDPDKLIVSQPDNADIGFEILYALVESGKVDIAIVDSVDAIVPQSILDSDFSSSNMGVIARLMSQGLRKLTTVIRKSNTAVIFISQIRNKIGVMYGSPETESGGLALKYYATLRVDMRVIDKVKEDDEIIGNVVKIKTIKNKVGSPFKEVEADLLFSKGFDKDQGLIEKAIENNLIVKAGSWFSYKNERIGQGKKPLREWVSLNKKLLLEELESVKVVL